MTGPVEWMDEVMDAARQLRTLWDHPMGQDALNDAVGRVADAVAAYDDSIKAMVHAMSGGESQAVEEFEVNDYLGPIDKSVETRSPVEGSCRCPHGERSLGRDGGIPMGRGIVRLSTMPGCPEHDSCQGYTAAVRAVQPRWSTLWCPIHRTKGCPTSTVDGHAES